MSAFKFQYYEDRAHALAVGEGLLPECSVGDPELRRLKQLTPCLYVLRATDHERQAVHRQYKFRSWSGRFRGKGHAQTALINARNSAHDFSVKLSPCIYVSTLTVAVLPHTRDKLN